MNSHTQQLNKVLITTLVPDQKTAWSKARLDVSQILERDGYATMYLPELTSPGKLLMFALSLQKRIAANAHIVIEYPFNHRRRAYLLYLFRRLTGTKIYTLIHDLNSIRFNNSASRELEILNLFDGVISHNPSMTRWLHGKGMTKKLVDLDIFDYCHNSVATYSESRMTKPVKILYAGNLSYSKATYIYDDKFNAIKNIEVSLYGAFFESERLNSSMLSYKGVFDPSVPILEGRYHFGLVWEGTSMETCDGEYGHYLRYNNPHKVSLYLSLGLPVIIWEQAAAAEFVLKQKIGLTIKNLKDLEYIHERIDTDKYLEMVENLKEVTSKVKRGDFLTGALDRLIKQ